MKIPTRIIGRACLLIASLIFFMGAGEIVFRILHWQPWAGECFDPVSGCRHIPNYVGLHNREAWVVSRINSQGLRDREYSIEKPPGVFRIAVLGDSYVEALQVPLERSFHKILEAHLNAAAGAHPRFEVISFGVSGNGTAQELLNYRLEAARYHPDLVLLAFTWHNDISDNSKELQSAFPFPQGWMDRPFFELRDGKLALDDSFIELHRRLEAEHAARPRSWIYALWMDWIKPRSYFLRFLNQQWRFAKWRLKDDPRASGAPPFDLTYDIMNPQIPPAWQRAWRTTEAIIAQLRDECRTNGSRLGVMEVTFGLQLYPEFRERAPYNLWPQTRGFDFDQPCRFTKDMMQRLAVPYLALTPAFQEDFGRTHRYLHGTAANPNAHWNIAGHALAAKELERFLYAERLVPVKSEHDPQ